MRIGLITNMMDGQSAGIGRYTENLVKNLLLIDKENKYYLIHSNKKSYKFKGNYQEIKLPFFDSIPKKLITGTFLFEKICRDYKLDILHDLGQISPFFFKSKTKKVLTIFDLTPILFPQFFIKLTNFYTKLFPAVLKNTDHVITISENSKNDIRKIFKTPKEKITVTHLGIDGKFKPIKDKEYLEKMRKKYNLPERFILFVGTIEPRKNLPLLFSAFAKIKNNFGVKLVIVGKMGWKYKPILKILDKLDVKKDVIFTDFIKDDHLPVIYNLADAFAYPSFYEGFGLPILEALACGCPVIASEFIPLPQNLKKYCFLINPKDELTLKRTIEKLFADVKSTALLAKKGHKVAQEYDWIKCSHKTLNIYNALYD